MCEKENANRERRLRTGDWRLPHSLRAGIRTECGIGYDRPHISESRAQSGTSQKKWLLSLLSRLCAMCVHSPSPRHFVRLIDSLLPALHKFYLSLPPTRTVWLPLALNCVQFIMRARNAWCSAPTLYRIFTFDLTFEARFLRERSETRTKNASERNES